MKKMERLPGEIDERYKIGLEFTSLNDSNKNILTQEIKRYDKKEKNTFGR